LLAATAVVRPQGHTGFLEQRVGGAEQSGCPLPVLGGGGELGEDDQTHANHVLVSELPKAHRTSGELDGGMLGIPNVEGEFGKREERLRDSYAVADRTAVAEALLVRGACGGVLPLGV
jgi:hypothetical protein